LDQGIGFVGLSVQGDQGMDPLTSGYQFRARLPGYDAQTFASAAEAEAWIEAERIGSVDGLYRLEGV